MPPPPNGSGFGLKWPSQQRLDVTTISKKAGGEKMGKEDFFISIIVSTKRKKYRKVLGFLFHVTGAYVYQ